MQDFEHRTVDAIGVQPARPAETLLITQYRCWMAGYSTRDITCWEIAWTALETATGWAPARLLFGEFHCFVRTILQTARRDIGWRPAACRCLCADESIILALVGASQQQDRLAEAGFASDFLGHDGSEALLAASRSLARALTNHDLVLQPFAAALLPVTDRPRAASHRLH